MQKPKLRDSHKSTRKELYPLGDIPAPVVLTVSKWLTYNIVVGKSDITGDDWGNVFARSIKGSHLASPLGLADVVHEKTAWSVKTVTASKPHTTNGIRIISGRNSPKYSYGIENPFKDIQQTGSAVLNIWNERVNISLDQYEDLRTAILIRNTKNRQYSLYEFATSKYSPRDFFWELNKNNNFIGRCRTSGAHKFTWQSHGSQFTIKHTVPASAIRFEIQQPKTLDFEKTMEQVGFNESWVSFI